VPIGGIVGDRFSFLGTPLQIGWGVKVYVTEKFLYPAEAVYVLQRPWIAGWQVAAGVFLLEVETALTLAAWWTVKREAATTRSSG
jgi:hypothetical protein